MGIDRRLSLRSALRLVVCGLLYVFAATQSASAQAISFADDVRAMRTAARSFASSDGLRRPASGTYDVVALRVEFQPDTTRFTTGDGTFGGSLYDGLEPSIDPLPHDAAYFGAHLDFLSDYVGRVSDGIVDVRTHLLPEIVRLPHPMAAYAPTGPNADSDEELRKLAAMVRDAWTSASQHSSFDMSAFDPERTALVLFHAGVGRDIDLIGTTLDKTPQDLPSIFFDERALGRLLGQDPLSFNGFTVNHSLIIPRTETRRAMDFIADEPFLLELSINGMLAASFFNFLGVPDLFDTETGESAIGPFGLMDPQGIFAYRGLFPPEPMAWTKLFLGWTEPFLVGDGGQESVSLEAASVAGSSESAQVLISNAEYLMVENRFRDPEDDGLILRVFRDGAVVEQHVENGDPEFNNRVVDGFIGGVVVGVDNYDWALPGGVDENDNELNGGILIWHIDERRLRAGFAENAVNVGTGSRAVDLEEADGAQDIGFPSVGPFGPQAELGSPFDFWYEGNPVAVLLSSGREVKLYANRFGPDTFPSSETNAGGPSFVVLEDFSPPAAEMSFVYRQEAQAGIEPGTSYGTSLEFGVGSFVGCFGACGPLFYSASADSVILHPNATHAAEKAFVSETQPVTNEGSTSGTIVSLERHAGAYQIVVRSYSDAPAVVTTVMPLPEDVSDMLPISPIVQTNFERAIHYNVLMGDGNSTVLVSAGANGETNVSALSGEAVSLAAEWTNLGSVPLVVGRRGTSASEISWAYAIPDDANVGQAVFGTNLGGLTGAVPATDMGELHVLQSDGDVVAIDVRAEAERFGAAAGDTLSGYPMLADLDGDGYLDVVAAYGGLLFAFSQSGAVLANFPIRVPGQVVAQPLLYLRDETPVLVAASTDGYIFAYDTTVRQRLIDGFPLEVGSSVLATPAFLNAPLDQPDNILMAVSEHGEVKSWTLPGVTAVLWRRLYGSPDNSSFATLASTDPTPPAGADPLIDATETYNWPNPIRDGKTHLRIATRRDAHVRIRIVDAAGLLVDDVEMGPIRAGIPAEVLWQSDDVASGLYFARFTATSAEGVEETKLVKMAIIR